MAKVRFLAAFAALVLPGVPAAAQEAIQGLVLPPYLTMWNGPYIGVIGGGGNFKDLGLRWAAGADVGYLHQLGPSWVAGIEGDITGTTGTESIGFGTVGNASCLTLFCGSTELKTRWNATLRVRVGYIYSLWSMVYATGGVAFTSLSADTDGTNPPVSPDVIPITVSNSQTRTRTGWTAGFGVETIFNNGVTGRAEFRFTDFGRISFPGDPNPDTQAIPFQSGDFLLGLDIAHF